MSHHAAAHMGTSNLALKYPNDLNFFHPLGFFNFNDVSRGRFSLQTAYRLEQGVS